jgi:hypothetical protein
VVSKSLYLTWPKFLGNLNDTWILRYTVGLLDVWKVKVPREINHLNSWDNLNVHLDKISDYNFSGHHKNFSNGQVYCPCRNPFLAMIPHTHTHTHSLSLSLSLSVSLLVCSMPTLFHSI